MLQIIVLAFGLAFTGAGAFISSDIMHGPVVLQPYNPRGLYWAVMVGGPAFLAGAITGFFLSDWWWLILAAVLFVGLGVVVDGLKSTGPDRLPGVAILAVAAGTCAEAVAIFLL